MDKYKSTQKPCKDRRLIEEVEVAILSLESIILCAGTRYPGDKSIALGYKGWSHHKTLRAALRKFVSSER